MSPAVFLDRDGTLVEEVPYLHRPEQVALLPGAATALRALADAGFALVVVTNQAGVARGRYGEAAVAATHRRLAELLAAEDVALDGIWYCPHHPDGQVPAYARACTGRKPRPGMLHAAATTLGLDLARSWLIGNHPDDAAAAHAAGAAPLFVTTGDGAARPAPPAVPALPDLTAAAAAVLAGDRPGGQREPRRPAPRPCPSYPV